MPDGKNPWKIARPAATALMDAVEGGRADVGWEAEDSLQRGGD